MISGRFFGDRLAEAREVVGFTKTELASRIGVTSQAIGQWENCKKFPEGKNIERLSLALGFNIEFFFTPPVTDDLEQVFWRSRKTETQKQRRVAKVKMGWVSETFSFFSENFLIQGSLPPVMDFPAPILDLHSTDIEQIARDVRYQLGLGLEPIDNVTNLLENLGIPVVFFARGPEKQDAFTWYSRRNDCRFVGVNLYGASSCKVRFDVAHELWHILAHTQISEEDMEDDAILGEIEKQADYFAGAFLFPAEMFHREISRISLDDFSHAKPRWKVEIASMIMRSIQLGLIDKERQTDLFRKMSQRKWRGVGRKEPYDESIQFERPGILRSLFKAAELEEPNAFSKLKSSLPIKPSYFEEILDVDNGYLGRSLGLQGPAKVIQRN